MVRNNIVLVKRETPLRVTLPNGRTFLAKYKRVNRQWLPGGTTIARIYKGHPVQGRKPKRAPAAAADGRKLLAWLQAYKGRRRGKRKKKQGRKGLGDVVRSIASNPYAEDIGKKAPAKGINYIPSLFKKGTKRIKNKHLRKLAQSEIALDLVDKGTKRLLRESNDLVGGI